MFKYLLVLLVLLLTINQSLALLQTKRAISYMKWGTVEQFTYLWEYLPVGFANGTKFPILIFCHGQGENANGNPTLTTLDKVLLNSGSPPYMINNNQWDTTLPFIVLSPQAGYGHGWNSIQDAIEAIKLYYSQNADFNRVYLTGLSQGGGGTFYYAGNSLSNSQYIAALAPVCAWANSPVPTQTNFDNIINAKLPVWAFHGDADTTVNKTTNTDVWIAGIQSTNPPPLYTVFSGGNHNIWGSVYNINRSTQPNNIYDWFLTKSRGIQSTTASTTGPSTTASTTSTTGPSTTASTTSTTGPSLTTTSTTGSPTTTTSSSTTGSNCNYNPTVGTFNTQGTCTCSVQCSCN